MGAPMGSLDDCQNEAVVAWLKPNIDLRKKMGKIGLSCGLLGPRKFRLLRDGDLHV
jgi:hypothetical protein